MESSNIKSQLVEFKVIQESLATLKVPSSREFSQAKSIQKNREFNQVKSQLYSREFSYPVERLKVIQQKSKKSSSTEFRAKPIEDSALEIKSHPVES